MDTRNRMILVAMGNVLLALTAYAREASMASVFGADSRVDAWLVAYGFTDMTANMILGAAIYAVSLPLLVQADPHDRESVHAGLLYKALCCGVGLGLAIILAAPLLSRVLAPGIGPEGWVLCTRLLAWTSILPVSYCIAGVLGARLNSAGSFWATSLAPVILNATMIAGMHSLGRGLGVTGLAVGASIGSIAMLVPFIPHLGWPRTGVGGVDIRSTLTATAFVLGLNQAIPLVERFFASLHGSGGISAMNYAYKLAQAPYWIAGVAVTQVLFPSLSRTTGDYRSFKRALNKGLGAISALVLPVSVCLFVWAPAATNLLFARGAFHEGAGRLTAEVVRGYCLGTWAQACLGLLTRAVQANREWKPLVMSSGLGLASAVLADSLLHARFGVPGIAVGSSVGVTVAALVLSAYLYSGRGPADAALLDG